VDPFVHRLRVRYVECDMQGIVFNAHYYTWIDIAHTEWLRVRFGPISELLRHGVDVVVAESSCRYLAPVTYDEDIDIEVGVESLGTTSLTTVHTFRRDDQVVAEGRVRHVCVATDGTGKTPWPDDLRAALSPSADG
jgi:acyl-CoA thioester hydrolase